MPVPAALWKSNVLVCIVVVCAAVHVKDPFFCQKSHYEEYKLNEFFCTLPFLALSSCGCFLEPRFHSSTSSFQNDHVYALTPLRRVCHYRSLWRHRGELDSPFWEADALSFQARRYGGEAGDPRWNPCHLPSVQQRLLFASLHHA